MLQINPTETTVTTHEIAGTTSNNGKVNSRRKASEKTGQLDLNSIQANGGTQPRQELNESHINNLIEQLELGATLPPVTVFYDGKSYWLADGFHRLAAHSRIHRNSISVDVCQGTQRDAILYSVGANSDHGLPRSNQDKRRAVMRLLNDEEWGQWSDREIAKRCRVHNSTVSRIKQELSQSDSTSQSLTNKSVTYSRNGRTATMDTSNIGKGKEDSIPTLKWLINEWSRVGDVIKIPKYPNGFAVYNDKLTFIDWVFQSRKEAWKIWQEKGTSYIESVRLYKLRHQSQQIEDTAPIDVKSVIVAPNSCFECIHHERDGDHFICKARGGFELGLDADRGSDCSHHKHRETAMVTEFSVRNKPWAQPTKIQRPFTTELEAIGLLLDSLAWRRRRSEEEHDTQGGIAANEQIVEIGQALRAILAVEEEKVA